jgi:hypothetical protein
MVGNSFLANTILINRLNTNSMTAQGFYRCGRNVCRPFQSISSICCEVTITANCLDLCACKLMEATSNCSVCEVHIQGGSNMTGTNCDLFTHNQSRSYLNHLVFAPHSVSLCMSKPLHSRCSSVFTALVLEHKLVQYSGVKMINISSHSKHRTSKFWK